MTIAEIKLICNKTIRIGKPSPLNNSLVDKHNLVYFPAMNIYLIFSLLYYIHCESYIIYIVNYILYIIYHIHYIISFFINISSGDRLGCIQYGLYFVCFSMFLIRYHTTNQASYIHQQMSTHH